MPLRWITVFTPHRRAVGEVDDALGRDAVTIAEHPDALHDFGARLVRRGEHLQRVKCVRLLVECTEIRERAADVDADAVAGPGFFPIHLFYINLSRCACRSSSVEVSWP